MGAPKAWFCEADVEAVALYTLALDLPLALGQFGPFEDAPVMPSLPSGVTSWGGSYDAEPLDGGYYGSVLPPAVARRALPMIEVTAGLQDNVRDLFDGELRETPVTLQVRYCVGHTAHPAVPAAMTRIKRQCLVMARAAQWVLQERMAVRAHELDACAFGIAHVRSVRAPTFQWDREMSDKPGAGGLLCYGTVELEVAQVQVHPAGNVLPWPPSDPAPDIPPEVAAILALEPDVYAPIQYASLPGYGQILWQDAARTTPVEEIGDPIGSARNLGSLGGYAEAEGAARPEWRGAEGARFDGVGDRMVLTPITTVGQPMSWLLYCTLGEVLNVNQRIVSNTVSPDTTPAIALSTNQLTSFHGGAETGVGPVIAGPTGQCRIITDVIAGSETMTVSGGLSGSATSSGTKDRVYTGVVLGSRGSIVEQYWKGDIRAVFARNTLLTSGEKATLPELL